MSLLACPGPHVSVATERATSHDSGMQSNEIDRAQFEKIRAELTLDTTTYARYARQVGDLADRGFCLRYFEGTPLNPVRSRWVASRLFKTSFLVVELAPGDFARFYPGRESLVPTFDSPFVDDQLPPIVLAPATDLSGQVPCAVLEHAFVHVNQIMRRRLEVPWGAFDAELAGTFFLARARGEYEASFVQGFLQSEERSQELSLAEEAILCGYRGALQQTLLLFARQPGKPRELHRWAQGLRHWSTFEGIGPVAHDESWLQDSLERLILSAAGRLRSLAPGVASSPGFRTLLACLSVMKLGDRGIGRTSHGVRARSSRGPRGRASLRLLEYDRGRESEPKSLAVRPVEVADLGPLASVDAGRDPAPDPRPLPLSLSATRTR